MKESDKVQCPKCQSLDVFDTGNRWSSGQDYVPGKSIEEPIQPTYECNKCKEYFVLINYVVCPKCNSKNVKQSGPYASLKPEGQLADRGPMEIYYYCWDCKYDWEDKI